MADAIVKSGLFWLLLASGLGKLLESRDLNEAPPIPSARGFRHVGFLGRVLAVIEIGLGIALMFHTTERGASLLVCGLMVAFCGYSIARTLGDRGYSCRCMGVASPVTSGGVSAIRAAVLAVLAGWTGMQVGSATKEADVTGPALLWGLTVVMLYLTLENARGMARIALEGKRAQRDLLAMREAYSETF